VNPGQGECPEQILFDQKRIRLKSNTGEGPDHGPKPTKMNRKLGRHLTLVKEKGINTKKTTVQNGGNR